MRITYEGHSCFLLESADTSILFDPFLKVSNKTAEQFHPDAVVLSHGHADHVGSAFEIAKANSVPVVGMSDMLDQLEPVMGEVKKIGFNIGGTVCVGSLKIKMVPAWHGPRVNAVNGCCTPAGYIVDDGENRFYFAGDTALFGDMKMVIARHDITVAALPVGGHYTMDIEDAAVAAEWLGAKYVIPMHYNTFPLIKQDIGQFERKMEAVEGCVCKVMGVGETWVL